MQKEERQKVTETEMFGEMRGHAKVSRPPKVRMLGSSQCRIGVNALASIELGVQESTEMD